MVFAKKKSILVEFNDLFAKRKVQKTYLAIVKNKPQKSKGNLVNFLVKNNQEKERT
ncbi:pseudouridine synthase [Zobellia nedashkovskayae]